MILQAGAYSVRQLLDHLEQIGRKAGYAGLRRLRFSFFLDEPRGFAGVWANIPGDAQSFARVQLS